MNFDNFKNELDSLTDRKNKECNNFSTSYTRTQTRFCKNMPKEKV